MYKWCGPHGNIASNNCKKKGAHMALTTHGINNSKRKRGTLEREDTELQGCNMIKESPFETV